MPIGAATYRRNGRHPRQPVTPPHVPIKALRIVAGITLEMLAEEIGHITGIVPTRGTLSAIEAGARGASADIIAAIEKAYGLPAGMITTTYRPRMAARRVEE